MNHHHTNILYKRNVCVFGGQQRKNDQTNCVEILHRYFLRGVFPFRNFTLFQDGVPYSAVTSQSAACCYIFNPLHSIRKTVGYII